MTEAIVFLVIIAAIGLLQTAVQVVNFLGPHHEPANYHQRA